MGEQRWFPIMGGPPIPWSAMAPHEAQAASNHGQTLERLAERGGLSPGEAVAVMSGRRWRRMSDADASSELARLVAEYEGRASVRLHQLREDIERDRAARNIGVGLAMVAHVAHERELAIAYVRLCSRNAYLAGDGRLGLALSNLAESLAYGHHNRRGSLDV